jgi:hypothetical protein
VAWAWLEFLGFVAAEYLGRAALPNDSRLAADNFPLDARRSGADLEVAKVD